MKRLVRYPLFLTLVALLAAACEGDGLTGPEVEELPLRGGCGDVLFYAVDDADEVMLTFIEPGAVEDARELGDEWVQTFDFGHGLGFPRPTLRVVQGTRVSDATCDDVLENGGPQIQRSWTAVQGRSTLRVRPLAGQEGAMADLVLENIVFHPDDDSDGRTIRIDRMEWIDVFVGWLPG